MRSLELPVGFAALSPSEQLAASGAAGSLGGARVDVPVREVLRPESVVDALAVLSQRPDALPIAGGTDLMVQLRDGRKRSTVLVDLDRLGLAGVRDTDQGIAIGAATRMDVIAADPRIRRLHPALAEAAAQVGAWPIQCRATLGGNLANASPAADTAPALIVGGALVAVASTAGARQVPVEEFFLAPGRSALTPGELILSILLPPLQQGPGVRVVERFVKVGPRREQIISVASLAGRALVADSGVLAELRLALGSVAATPVRAHRTEHLLTGRRLDAELRREAVRVLQNDITPIDDVRAPADYRRIACAVLLDRFLQEVASG
ncbi:MAG TPA: FAD binding domain-containing protein [Thermoanaerobaculaceae bacterium]|nr:FAD binding domain-containing protein [Thermoanaerobaculaceae bacterium]